MFYVVLEGKTLVNICPCTIFKYVEYREENVIDRNYCTVKHIFIDCLASKTHHVSEYLLAGSGTKCTHKLVAR